MLKKYQIKIPFFFFFLQVLLVQWLASKPDWVEVNYTQGFYWYLSNFLRTVFGLINFSVGQLIFYSLLLLIIYWLFRLCRFLWNKKITLSEFIFRFFKGVLIFLCGFYFVFTLMWGLNYNRIPIQTHVNINDKPFTIPELKGLCTKLIALTNQSRIKLTSDTTQAVNLPFKKKQLLTLAFNGYTQASLLNPVFTYTKPAIKAVFVPEIMSFFGISGIYFPFTGEANVNMGPPDFILPEIISHEMAHQIGFASEDEANYVAYLVCRLHPEPAFQYSGNLMAMKYAMQRLNSEDSVSFKILKTTITPGVIHDLKKNRAYWESFQNPMEVVGELIHDLFLKANNQEEGLKSYSRVVELLMGEYRKNGLNYTENDKLNYLKPIN